MEQPSTGTPRFTLDTNCIIALEEKRAEAAYINQLIEAHARQIIELSVVAISASEKQKDGRTLENFNDFIGRLTALGLEKCNILKPMLYYDICFYDWASYGSDEMVQLEHSIHSILFPGIEFLWPDYCAARKLPIDTIDHKWRNAKCDTLALWSHVWYRGDIFVTSDKNFHSALKQDVLRALGVGEIETPEKAVTHIPTA